MALSSLAPTSSRKRGGGFTLLEILVVSAIAAILVVTAASLLVTMSSQRAANRKRLERLTQSFTAMTLLERSLLNAGYHFPSARFGFRVYDNVTTGSSYGGIVVGAPCPGLGCIVPNSDVLEVVEGVAPQPAEIIAVSAVSSSAWQVQHQPPGGPLFLVDAGTGDHLLLFGTTDGGNCAALGQISAIDGGPQSIGTYTNVRVVDRNLAPQPNTYYSTGNGVPERAYDCPHVGDETVSAAAVRHLYMVIANDGGVRGLYQVDMSPLLPGETTLDAGAITVLARGIDNFQVMPLVFQPGSGLTTGCSNNVCECNSGGSCSITGVNSNAEFAMTSRIVGVKIGLSARGETEESIVGAAVVPNRLGNETLAADKLKRTTQTQTYMLRNFAQVSP